MALFNTSNLSSSSALPPSNLGIGGTSTTTPMVVPTTTSTPKTVPVSAVTSSAPAVAQTQSNIQTLQNGIAQQTDAQRARAAADAAAADAKAKLAAEAIKASASSTSSTTTRTDNTNATDANGNRVYIADPSLNQGSGFTFDNPQYNPRPLDAEKNTIFDDSMKQIDADLKKHQDALDYIASGADPAEQALLQGIKDSYARRAEALAQQNKARLDSMGTMGIRSGRARYASELQTSIIGQEEAAGNARIQELHSQEMAELNAAQTAYRTGKYDQLAKTMATLEKARTEKSALIQKQFENTQALEQQAIQKSQEERAQFNERMAVQAKQKEDAFAKFDILVESGTQLKPEDFQALAKITEIPVDTLTNLYTEREKQKQLANQKLQLALSGQQADINATNALTAERLAGIKGITSTVKQAATNAGITMSELTTALSNLGDPSTFTEQQILGIIQEYAKTKQSGGTSGTSINQFIASGALSGTPLSPDAVVGKPESSSGGGSSVTTTSSGGNWWD